MYVCVCHAVTDRDIGEAVAQGCCSLRELREQFGVGSCCGRCKGCAKKVLRTFIPAHANHQLTATANYATA